MTQTLPITKAREKIKKYESWKETMEIMADPELMKAIKEGEEDIKKGRFVTLDQLKKELKLD